MRAAWQRAAQAPAWVLCADIVEHAAVPAASTALLQLARWLDPCAAASGRCLACSASDCCWRRRWRRGGGGGGQGY